MQHGQVRSILWRHAMRPTPTLPPLEAPATDAADLDPNALLPASRLRAGLADLPAAEQRRRGNAYAHLWARTFPTLVAHLRGRPERALALFAEEVYPFLRGDRLAARVERTSQHGARVLLAADLPPEYLAGLLEGFVALSGANSNATADGPGLFQVRFQVASTDRLARLAQTAATLRLPLLAAALLSALLGVAFATRLGSTDPARIAAVLAGVVLAQTGANALHDLRSPAARPWAFRPGSAWLKTQAIAGFTLAAILGGWLALDAPLLLPFAAAGVVASLLADPLRQRGLGPAVAVLVYGPLIAEGALHALATHAAHNVHLGWALLSLTPGALAAAFVHIGDLADRPLDEAGGARTLAVRLPPRRQALAVHLLLALGMAPLVAAAWLHPRPLLVAATAVLGACAIALGLRVSAALDDPHRLAPARVGAFALHLATSAILLAAVLGGAA